MSRRSVPFRQADVTRAVRGAVIAGVEIGRVEIDRLGKIVIVPRAEAQGPGETDAALDRELAEFEARDEGTS